METVLEVKRVSERKDGVKMVLIPKRSKLIKDELVVITNDTDIISKLKREGKI